MSKNYLKPAMILISITLCGCASWFSGMSTKERSVPLTATAPKTIVESNPIIPPINGKKSSSGTQVATGAYSATAKQRIEEDRNAGEVEQIKVNNRNLPAYYIYPTQQQNYNTNKLPDQNVSTPNWQISW